jgi:hypothetical protein
MLYDFSISAVVGSFTITMTDNATFVAGVSCLSGKENFWWVLSTTPKLDPAVHAKTQQYFNESGFTAPIGVEGVTPVFFKHFKMNAGLCKQSGEQ